MRRLSAPQSAIQEEETQDPQPRQPTPLLRTRLREQSSQPSTSSLAVPSTQPSAPPSTTLQSLPPTSQTPLEKLSSHLSALSTSAGPSGTSLSEAQLSSPVQQQYSSSIYPGPSLSGAIPYSPRSPDNRINIKKQDPKKEDVVEGAGSGPEMSTSSSGAVGASSSESLPSLRGAPSHLRQEIIRRQNVEYQRRTRERRRAAYRNLVDQHQDQIEQITRLEARVAELIRILEDAGIEIPDVVSERMGDTEADDGRRLLAELETYIDEYNRSGEGQPFGDEDE